MLLTNISTLHPLIIMQEYPLPLQLWAVFVTHSPMKVWFTYWMVILKLLFREKCSSVASLHIHHWSEVTAKTVCVHSVGVSTK